MLVIWRKVRALDDLPAALSSAQAGVEPRYKVRLIEEAFKRLMFDVKDV